MSARLPGIRFTELPLWVLCAGYAEFLWHTAGPGGPPVGIVQLLALVVLSLLALLSWRETGEGEPSLAWKEWRASLRDRDYIFAAAWAALVLFLAGMLTVGAWSALRPPFLPQEYDAINYQMGVPRQLLVRGSLARIEWSVPDLWPMAMQWAMAPLTSLFGTINKVPQLLLSLGGFAVMVRLARTLAGPSERSLVVLLPATAFYGGHGVMIQLGTGMMDLPALYLLLLGVLGLVERRYLVAAAALALYVASKSFFPFQIGAAVLAGLIWAWRGRRPLREIAVRFLVPLCLLSLLFLARPFYLSLSATGTPLFPFLACRFHEGTECSEARRPRMDESVRDHLSTAADYGNGQGPLAFAVHLWRVAVPTKGVNNEYDYPLGLPWLLFLVLGTFAVATGGWRRPVLGLSVLFWALWWLNAHQARWLYPTLAFGLLATLEEQRKARKLLPALLTVSVCLSLISQVRSLRPTLALSAGEIRAQERAKVRWEEPGKLAGHELLYVDEPAHDVAPGGRRWTFR